MNFHPTLSKKEEDLCHPPGSSEEITEGSNLLPPNMRVSLIYCHFCFYFFSSSFGVAVLDKVRKSSQ